MVIDVNAYIGHYPFRQIKLKTAADLIGLMDEYEIDLCCTSSLNAIYYKDCMEGNHELLDEIAAFKDRLIPFCTINPEYNGARDDFKQCVKKLGFKGLRLFPRQHGYKLDSKMSVAMLNMAGEMNIPVHIPIQLEDLRGHHPLDIEVAIGEEEIKCATLLAPNTDIILSNAYLDGYARVIESACKARLGKGKVYYDIGRVDCLGMTMMEELIKEAGYERIIFGTGAILQIIPVQFVKLHYMETILGTTPGQIEEIKSGTLARLLGLI